MNDRKRLIFHIDVNSAFLSWSAAYNIQHGDKTDLRNIPAVIGGDPLSRHGIVLAKSISAKKYGIQTGEPLLTARQKCPNLTIVPPKYDLYVKCSNIMVEVLKEYTPHIQRYSIDECFLDFTDMENLYSDYFKLAFDIKERIKNELGFTVNIGISNNKLLAKMASDFKKPDRIHTLFPYEIKEKMWPLPIEDLFMVGRASVPKLHRLNIYSIGDLAKYDLNTLNSCLKSFGTLIWNYANGIEDSEVRKSNFVDIKGMGNSTTIAFDVKDRETAHMILLSLAETLGMRLRNSENYCHLVSVHIKSSSFSNYSHQRKLYSPTDSTSKIAKTACNLFDQVWNGEPIRHLGIYITDLCSTEFYQLTIFDDKSIEKTKKLDKTIDDIRMRYGSNSIIRSIFLHSGLKPLTGGIGDGDVPNMSSIL